MGDEDRRKFISSNIVKLTDSTFIGTELVVSLFEKYLINDSDKDLLLDLDSRTSNLTKAMMLYTETATKWDESQFEDFKKALQETGNLAALKVFTTSGADVFLTMEQVQLLRQQRDKSKEGSYEGLFLEDEEKANRLLQIAKGDGMFQEDGKFLLSAGFDRKVVTPLVSHFEETLKNNLIWWNPRKPPLPKNYITRTVAPTEHLERHGRNTYSKTTLIDLVTCNLIDSDDDESNEPRSSSFHYDQSFEDVLVLIVDPPGMGKSSEMSDLENKLRMKVTSNRVILRVNLNEVQRTLSTLSPSESASSVLLKLAPFIPSSSLETVEVSVFVLLDGLDEVCPKHKDKMIKLLRKFTSDNEPTLSKNLRVFVTTRPHLKEAMKEEFNVNSYSLLPLTEDEQNEYMSCVLEVSSVQLGELRGNLRWSVEDLLEYPLILSIFVEVIKSEGTFSGGSELNTFELYTRYVDSKHKLHLVEKEGMRLEDNFTEMRLEGLLERNLPHYYRVAIQELIDEDEDGGNEDSVSEDEGTVFRPQRLVFAECKGNGLVAQDEPSRVNRVELLSLGLLIEASDNKLIFKHRSFAEFFYARLLTQEEAAPQGVTDILFHCIYIRNPQQNVESLLVGASSLAPPTYTPQPPLLFSLSPKWLILSKDINKSFNMLNTFCGSKSFPLLVREVLLSFVNGDPKDLVEAQLVLFHEFNRESFRKLFDWMSENREWTREELLKINQVITATPPTCHPPKVANEVSEATARLMFLIGLFFEGQELLSQEEVSLAANLIDRLIYFVGQFQTETGSGRSKWEWVEGLLSGGRSQLKQLFLETENADWSVIIGDKESACKLVSLLTRQEISARITDHETRVSDVIGEQPLEVIVALGEEFVPRGKQLAEFRGKFWRNKGKTVFEMKEGWGLALDYLCDDLLGEVRRGDFSDGPVCVALSEAFGWMGGSSWELLQKLERLVQWRFHKNSEEKEDSCGAEDVRVKLMDWVTRGLQWDSTFTPDSLQPLPFLLRYYGNTDATHFTNLLQHNQRRLKRNPDDLMAVLRSLIIVSPPRSHDNEDSSVFSILTAFLLENLNGIYPQFRSLAEVLLGATREQIATAATSLHLVGDVSVGLVALNLLATLQPATIIEKPTLERIVVEVIEVVACCDLPTIFQQICRLMQEQNGLELLKEVLTSGDVFGCWRNRFSREYWREWKEPVNLCGVRNLLSFYFSTFGLNCDWMRMHNGVEVRGHQWTLIMYLPVEISNALRGNPHWTHLLPQFQEILRERLRRNNFYSVCHIAEYFSFKTEGQWEALLSLTQGEALLPATLQDFPDISTPVFIAPLIRTLLKLYGVEWTKSKLTAEIWNAIPSNVKYKNRYGVEIWLTASTVGSLGSLLHSGIELGELEEVKRRAWPGVVSWKNGEGKTALQLATEEYDERHPIRLHLEHVSLQ